MGFDVNHPRVARAWQEMQDGAPGTVLLVRVKCPGRQGRCNGVQASVWQTSAGFLAVTLHHAQEGNVERSRKIRAISMPGGRLPMDVTMAILDDPTTGRDRLLYACDRHTPQRLDPDKLTNLARESKNSFDRSRKRRWKPKTVRASKVLVSAPRTH